MNNEAKMLSINETRKRLHEIADGEIYLFAIREKKVVDDNAVQNGSGIDTDGDGTAAPV